MNTILAILYRDYRQRRTNIGFAFWDLLVPVAYLLLFGTGFERAVSEQFVVDGRTIPYAAFFLPGVLAMTAFTIAMNTSWSFFIDKDSGIFYEILTYPMTRRQFLVGKICFNVMLSTLGSFLSITLAVLVLGVQIEWRLLPLTLAAIIGTTAGWFFFLSTFAVRFRRMDTFNTFTSAAYIFFMFLSTLFYPIDQTPLWFRAIAWINPMTWQADIMRYSLLGVGATSIIALEALAFGIFGAICLAAAVHTIDHAA